MAHKIVPGGERVGKSPASGPALRANGDRRRSVRRRSGRRPAEPYTWVKFWRFALAWTAFMALCAVIGLERVR